MKPIVIALSLLLPSTLFVTPAFGAECPSQSIAELKSKFEAAFRSKDRVALLSLFNWLSVEPEFRVRMESDLSGMLSKELLRTELRDASLAETDAKSLESRGLYLNVIPLSTLYFERSVGPDPREKTGGQLAIGRLGNCFMLGMYAKMKVSK